MALLLAAPTASASTEAGWNCVANDSAANRTLLASGGSGIPMPPSVPPEGPKVITGWKVQVGPGLGPISQRLEVFEIQNENSEFKKIGESATETLVEGTNSFATRIPADEGDSVGLYGPDGTLVCDKEAGAISLVHEGSVTTGETKFFLGAIEVGTPVVVTVEPDRDGDGYGDETQDKCPASAAYQADCPTVRPSVVAVAAKRGAILVQAKVDSEAQVKVFGYVRWFPRAGKGARGSTKRVPLTIGLSAGPPKAVAGGVTTTYRLPLPKAVKRRLGRLDPRRALRARITVSATDLAGRVTERKLVVRLPGREKPQPPQ